METCSTSLSKKLKNPHAKSSSPKQICDKREENQMWKGGGLQMQKMGMVGETRGRWWT